MTRYLIGFITDFILGFMEVVIAPLFIYIVRKDMRYKRKIDSGAIPYLSTTSSTSRSKVIITNIVQVLYAVFALVYLVAFQIPAVRDIQSLITDKFLYTEGTVSRVVTNKSFTAIYINNMELKDGSWFKSNIEYYSKYKIAYLKHSNYIVKAEKFE